MLGRSVLDSARGGFSVGCMTGLCFSGPSQIYDLSHAGLTHALAEP